MTNDIMQKKKKGRKEMRVVEPFVRVEKFDGIQMMKKIEKACRTCYRSEGNITEDSYKKLIKNCITRGHESVLEHEKVSVRIRADVGVYKDLTRHRIASFSVESTRYCSYDKDKYGNEISFINPVYITDPEIYKNWEETMKQVEKNYIAMKKLEATTDMCRLLLPHSTAAEFVMTANVREWKHIFTLRCSNHVHPAIRQVMIPLLLHFKKEMPDIFDEVPYDEEFNPEYYAELTSVEEI